MSWLISFILSITSCAFMIHKLKDKFTIDSIGIASDNKVVNISQIPFPAITIMISSEWDCEGRWYHEYYQKMKCFETKDFEGYSLDLDCEYSQEDLNITDPDDHERVIQECEDIKTIARTIFPVFKQPKYIDTELSEEQLNLRNYGTKIVPLMKENGMEYKILKMKLFWEEDFAAPVAKLMTALGMGYSFNIVTADDIFRDGNR